MPRSGPGRSRSHGGSELPTPSAPGTRRLLLLVPFSPRLDAHHGGSRAIAQLVAALSERHRLAVLYLRGREEAPMDEALAARCDLVREIRHAHRAGLGRRARQLRVALGTLAGTPMWVAWWAVAEYAECVRETAASWRPDVVHLEYHLMGQYLPALRECPAPRILVQYDPGIGSAPAARLRGLGLRLLARLDRWAWRRYETSIMHRVDAVVVFTERDRASVTPLAGTTPVVPIPLGAPVPERPSSPAGTDTATLLFVGSFAHRPNVDAAHRLVEEILPRVHARRPEARLVLVGTRIPADLRRRAGERVELAESVPDVRPYLDRASLVVVPLRLGGGMRVKVLEALAAGKAVVASRLAVEGLDLGDGRECCLAETDEEFSRQIVRLLDDDEQRRRLGTQARSWAEEHLPWSHVVAAYERLYQKLLAR